MREARHWALLFTQRNVSSLNLIAAVDDNNSGNNNNQMASIEDGAR